MICAAIVTAGGVGARMGSDIPKQYLHLNGIPILARTLAIFQAHPGIDFIVLTTPIGQVEYCSSEIVARYNLTKIRNVVQGGDSRQESVLNGLRLAQDSDFVVIHDAVRPFVEASVISGSIEKAKITGAAIAACAVSDTVKRGNGFIVETVPRDNLWLAHTPQTFRTSLIVDAHEKAMADGFTGTDDAALVERLGFQVAIVTDSSYNIKITSPYDMIVAERLVTVLAS
ncbi:MAG: 2-C-methyl-D-erythritol 4-phosphate cytidylyltransferase [Deltaproteobacteria bacterium]|nr:2-C-methyl-D-erythritol 4-phosphate cytidylyltransferase [Deltaproteobacteria bacterium]